MVAELRIRALFIEGSFSSTACYYLLGHVDLKSQKVLEIVLHRWGN